MLAQISGETTSAIDRYFDTREQTHGYAKWTQVFPHNEIKWSHWSQQETCVCYRHCDFISDMKQEHTDDVTRGIHAHPTESWH